MTMGRITFSPLLPRTVGFESILDEFERMFDSKSLDFSTFPPHNIIKLDANQYIVEMAVAGFTKDDIEIIVENNELIIKGSMKGNDKNVNYIYKGVAARAFTKSITLADTLEVRGTELKDGVLRIALENVIPDHKKPRKIEIENNLSFIPKKLLTE
jgi:molecular chaperone IbpA